MGLTLNGSNNTIYTDSGSAITVASGTKIVADSFSGLPYESGEIINVTHLQDTTRVVASATSSRTLWTKTVTKLIAGSTLHIVGQVPHSGGFSYNMGYWWQIGSSGIRRDSIFQKHWHSDPARGTAAKLIWTINGFYSTTATGTLNVSIGWASVNGGEDTPGNTNPNSNDSPVGGQITTDIIIFEVVD